jgi:hypothetical protein
VTSIDRGSTNYQDSCQTVYQSFNLVTCNNGGIITILDNLSPDNVGCNNCLIPNQYEAIPFCDSGTGVCLVGIVNNGDLNGRYPDNCYIEVFFVGGWEKQEVPPGSPPGRATYDQSTVLASLRWSATADFMKNTGGVMLNCTNHSI